MKKFTLFSVLLVSMSCISISTQAATSTKEKIAPSYCSEQAKKQGLTNPKQIKEFVKLCAENPDKKITTKDLE